MTELPPTPTGIPVHTGTWRDAMLAIRGAVTECETIEDIRELIRGLETEEIVRQERGRVRLDALARLIQAVAGDPESLDPDKEALRADTRSGLVLGICMGVAGLHGVRSDPELIDERLAQPQVEAARSLAIEDLESIFDFGMMQEGAKALTLFFLERAKAEVRFDDFRMALRLAQIVADGDDYLGWGNTAVTVLEHAMTMDVFNESEISDRLRVVRQIHDLLGPIVAAGNLIGEGAEVVEAAAEVSRDSFSLATDFGPYMEIVNRLDAAYEVTGNSTYLDDLILYCETPRPTESDEAAAQRHNDLALFLRRRALSLGNTTDLLAAEESQRQALDLTDREHPLWRLHSTNLAASEYALLTVYGASIASKLEQLRAHLPTLPFETDEDNLVDAANACLLSLTVELTAAAQHEEEASKPPLLRRALIAAEEGHRLFEASGRDEDATDLSLLADALRGLLAALDGDGCDEAGIAAMVESIDRTRRHLRHSAPILAITGWMLRELPESRDALIEALVKRYEARPMGVTSRRVFDYEVMRWSTCGILWRGDIADADELSKGVITAMLLELLKQAARCGASDIARAASDTPIAVAAGVISEAATQFALAGDAPQGAYLAQISGAVRATDTRLNMARREGVDGERLAPDHGSSPCLIAIVGWERTAVLLRPPGSDWELAADHPSEGLEQLDHLDWLGGEHTADGLLSLKRWLDDLEPVLSDVLAETVLRAQDGGSPVLCLATGCLSHYPLALLTARRPEIALPLPSSSSLFTDEAVATLRTPLGSNRCAFLAGSPTAPGAGEIDVDSDLAAVEAAGFEIEILGRAEGGEATDRWPPRDLVEVIHYAGHLVPTGPDVTEMILADDTRVPVHEIRESDLRAVRLAVLMCCDSSSARLAHSGTQIQHLAGAFLEAGTGAVIASLWPAFDRSAQLFTEHLYAALGSGSDIAAAFAVAVEAIRTHRVDGLEPFAHPVFWAGFTLSVGVGSGVDFAGSRSS